MKISTLGMGFALCGVTVGAIVWAQNSRPTAIGNAKMSVAALPTGASTTPTTTASSQKPLHYYDSAHISAGMFARPLPPAAPPPPPPPAPKPEVKPPPPPPPDPFANYVYTGTFTIGDQRVAILENA